MLAMMPERSLRAGINGAMLPHDADIRRSFRFPGPGAGRMMPPTAFTTRGNLPKLELKDGSYTIRVATPGVKQEHLQVELLGRRSLLVTTTSKPQAEEGQQQQQSVRRRPRSPPSHQLCKRVDLPCDADWASVQLSYADGMLTVDVAQKKHENAEAAAEDGEAAALAVEVKEGAARVEVLRAELAEAQRNRTTSLHSLRRARINHAQSLAKERRTLFVATDKTPADEQTEHAEPEAEQTEAEQTEAEGMGRPVEDQQEAEVDKVKAPTLQEV